MIASGINDGTVQIWNILSGGCDCVFQGHSCAVREVCWLATWNQVISASDDLTVRIWDVQRQTCSKIFAPYSDPVAALASSRDLLLVASTNGTVNIYDSQSGDIVHIIRSNDMTNSCFSIDGGKVLVASKNSGDIWDITTKMLMHVWSIHYNGEQAMFSPDGTRVASIYGKFLKIWKTNAGYNYHEASTHVRDTIDNVYISPDEQLVTLKSRKGVEILDAATGQSLFTHPVTNVLSIAFPLNSAFIAILSPHGTVQTWTPHTHLRKSITIDNDVFHIALSPDGSQLASLSQSHMDMKLWDLESEGCLAHL
jgi:WD40 repeat protein